MTEYQIQIPLGSLPVHLILIGNKEHGRVVFTKVLPFSYVFDMGENGIAAAFYPDEFHIIGDDVTEIFDYDTIYEYKELPVMLEWLKRQNLRQPL